MPESIAQVNVLRAMGELNREASVTELRLENGRVVRLLTAHLLEAETSADAPVAEPIGLLDAEPDVLTLPIVEERLNVGKRLVATGKVRLQKTTQTFETHLDEVLAVRSYDVERVVLNQPVDDAPAIRQEGDTTIYPLVEEQLIVTRQLVLKEELRVTRRDTERHDTRPVTLRRETIEVEREPLA